MFSTLFLIPVEGNIRLEVIRGKIVRIGGSASRREHLQGRSFAWLAQFAPLGFRRRAVGHTTSGRIDASSALINNIVVRRVMHQRTRLQQQRHRLWALRQPRHDVIT